MDNKSQNQNLESLFFKDSALNNEKVDKIVSNSLANADDGELYLQFEESENFVSRVHHRLHLLMSLIQFYQPSYYQVLNL